VADVKRILSDVPESHMAFWFTNGTVARNIYELVNAVDSCDKSIFEYHANSEKNDFYNWILDVLGDEILAKRIKNELDQHKFVKRLRKRIKELEKV